ncbi:Laccase-14 [Vitis vinifera]|uniref:Laccase-14 n=1 Tax=Vitis vinifera TaxID=29760 RepID=A0A438EBY7_VITVI|nr:Laccase-14 [Vitis vinifera]
MVSQAWGDMPRYPWTDGPSISHNAQFGQGQSLPKDHPFPEEGTLWWHAHSDWTRATVHGAIIIYPKNGTKYPFHKPDREVPIILGEWWKNDVNAVRDEGLQRSAENGTEVRVLEYNSTVEIVFQGTNVLAATHHPMHLHGYSFYVVGWGFGNFDEIRTLCAIIWWILPSDTISVPSNGWVAIRFEASNPGVWFMHCHVERHLTWGMETAFIVKNGKHPEAQMLSPPSTCHHVEAAKN